jgi:hypothetical protein
MAKIWRWIVPVAAAGGLLAATGTMPAEAASISTYSISIHAKNPHYVNVGGDTFVVYDWTGLQNATISGTVSGATSGDVLTLLAEPFHATHYSQVGTPATITSATQNYSFSVRPTLETKYEVQVTTGTTVDVTSKVQPVYVALFQNPYHFAYTKCTRTACTFVVNTKTHVPASAYRTETTKHWYLYLGVNRSNGTPSKKPPKYLSLWKASSVSKVKRLSSTSFEVTFSYRIGFDGKRTFLPFPSFCTKDALTKDGIGLPGHHSCGAKRIRSNIAYLG